MVAQLPLGYIHGVQFYAFLLTYIRLNSLNADHEGQKVLIFFPVSYQKKKQSTIINNILNGTGLDSSGTCCYFKYLYAIFIYIYLRSHLKKNTNKNLLSAFDKTTNVIFEN